MNKLIYRCPDCGTFLVPSSISFEEGLTTEYSLFCMKCCKDLTLNDAKGSIENDLDIYNITNADIKGEEPVVLRVDSSVITFESAGQAKAFLELDNIKDFIQDTNVLIRKIDPALYIVDGELLLTTNCILLDDDIVIPN